MKHDVSPHHFTDEMETWRCSQPFVSVNETSSQEENSQMKDERWNGTITNKFRHLIIRSCLRPDTLKEEDSDGGR